MKKKLVSIVIPTKNSALFLENCLKSIKMQTYSPIEILIIDGYSTDKTKQIVNKYNARLYTYVPIVKVGTFDAPHKRNYGAKKAKGEYIYYMDADMELRKNTISEAVKVCEGGDDAVILSEDSFGEGIWAQAKNLERQCYWGDDMIEAPRFFKKKIWLRIGGLDEELGGGGDDWDIYQKLLENGFKVGRIKSTILHNEGNLSLFKLCRKRFMYGRDTLRYVVKRPVKGAVSYFPFRKAYFKHWRLFLSRPKDSMVFMVMRTAEYTSGLLGILYSLVK